MYVILINNDNTMSAPKKQRIMQRSKLVDEMWFLVPPVYHETEMEGFTVMLEYVLPVSKRYKTEILSMESERYEDHLKYILPVDTELTSEAGKIELQLTFAKADIDENGHSIQKVRKVNGLSIEVYPISMWSDIIPDEALSAIDQRLIKVDAQMKMLNDMNETMLITKADDISYEEDQIQLVADGKKIGRAIRVKSCDDNLEDGIPVVDFSQISNSGSSDEEQVNNVIEF